MPGYGCSPEPRLRDVPLRKEIPLSDANIIETSDRDAFSFFDAASFWTQFRHGSVTVKGVKLHYVEGGEGMPLLLIPGWPQSWYAWRHVMPMLASGRRVIAIDPRGYGDSDRPASGYDMKTVAAELHGFADALGLLSGGGIDVVGHDIGTWISYAYASDWPEDVKRLALFDGAVPGVSPSAPSGVPTPEQNIKTWHFAFNRLNDLPELLLRGREREFLTWFFTAKSVRPWTIGPADMDEYVRIALIPGSARASADYYRASFSPEGLAQNRARAETKLQIPVLAYGADNGVAASLVGTLREIAVNVQGGVFANCGHYMPEEAPKAIGRELVRFFELPA